MGKMTDAERLRAAAALLEHKGWIQGTLELQGGYCMLGALRVIDQCSMMPEVPAALVDTIKKKRTRRYRTIGPEHARSIVISYNDRAKRTQCEVLKTMCQAAKLAEERGE